MMTMCLIFVEEIIRVICVHASQNGKPDIQKDKFYDKLVYVWVMKGTKELTLGIGDFNVHQCQSVFFFLFSIIIKQFNTKIINIKKIKKRKKQHNVRR